MNQRRTAHGVHFLRVTGGLAERARAHGELLRQEICDGVVPKLAKKTSN